MIFRTLKNRLVAGYLAGGALVSVAVVIFVGARMRSLLLEQLDHSLTDKMRIIRSACVQRPDGVHVELGRDLFQRMHDPDDPEFMRLSLAESGRVLLESPSLREIDLSVIGLNHENPVLEFVTLPDGRTLRAAGQYFYPAREPGATGKVKLHLIAAHDSAKVESASRSIIVLSLQGCAVALIVLAILIRWIVRRNLRFFHELSGRISRVSVEEGSEESIILADAPREVAPMMNRLNELMVRMNRALRNERRFTADAAHELRTPLAGLRNRIELALSRPRSNEEYEDALVELLDIEDWLERLVQSLLLLARLEAGTQRIDYEPLPVPDLIRRSWKPYFERAEESDFEVELICDPVFEPPRPLPIELLEIVCRNLFDNALSYTEAGGAIRVTVSETQPDLCIEVWNGPVTPDSIMPIEEVFQPFARGAQARTAGERHSGIGLALVRRIVRSLDGEIEASRPEEETFLMRVHIPIAYEREIADEDPETDQTEDSRVESAGVS